MSLVRQNPPALMDWTPDTLDDGCFTFGSDVYQIGVMLGELLKYHDVPSDAASLLQLLNSKVSANEGLQHAWLHV